MPAKALASADAYQSEGSGAPLKVEKKLPGRALPNTPHELDRPHDASTEIGTADLKFADQMSIDCCTSFFCPVWENYYK